MSLVASSAGDTGTTWLIPIPHPTTMLLRAESVRRELSLSDEQETAVTRILGAAELPLWRLRDLPPPERDQAAEPILESLRQRLGKVLMVSQMERLDQLILQAQSVRAILTPKVSKTLQLSDGQTERIRAILGPATPGADPARIQRDVRAVLSPSQHRILTSLLGSPFDLSKVPRVACKAPELAGVTAWVGSAPIALSQLRGKVVVVHFYAFGCINCVRNLPHYNAWFDRFSRDDVAIVGIHRPETVAERDIDTVRRKAAEAGIKYPVAVDNESRNWDAWANRIWPSVYLIDKKGVRPLLVVRRIELAGDPGRIVDARQDRCVVRRVRDMRD